MKKGLFIVIEGTDGTGKSTHARLLTEYLQAKGFDTVLTQEPTKGPIGQAIRTVLSGETKVSPTALALMFTADRADHVDSVIKPALEDGKAVISDRYFYSTIAYQSAQGVDEKWLAQLNSFAPEPDVVIVLEVPADQALSRINDRKKEVFESIDFQRKVQNNLLKIAEERVKLTNRGKAWKVISNSGSQEEVQRRIREFVNLSIPKPPPGRL